MIDVIFTVDYEIYGNGEGSLRELVYEPMQTLRAIFDKWNVPLVVFVEAAELELMDTQAADACLPSVKRQIRDCHEQGFEIGLHLHPQWYGAEYQHGKWLLDYRKYNLCRLTKEEILALVERSINWLRTAVGQPGFSPLSFRAGNWLFQPTETTARVLAAMGIKVDSSVFKGGLQRKHGLDYRPARRNGYYWRCTHDANTPAPEGLLWEFPIYTVMVPFWKMLTAKRLGLQRRSPAKPEPRRQRFINWLDYVRPMYPLKFDFCRMTGEELAAVMEQTIREDQEHPTSYKPIVAIGHTKDLMDTDSLEHCLSLLSERGIRVVTLRTAYDKCRAV